MIDKVSFTAMQHGTQEDYDLLAAFHTDHPASQADRVLEWLCMMDDDSP